MIEIANSDQEIIYCGEYVRKERVITHKHTLRKRRYRRDYFPTITRSTERRRNQFFDKVQGTAVTEIDRYFDYGFWRESPDLYPRYSNHFRTFNRVDVWEEVEEILQETAVKIVSDYDRCENRTKTTYHVPVIGHILHPNTFMYSKKNKIEAHWFLWNGKYYDPSYVYYFVTSTTAVNASDASNLSELEQYQRTRSLKKVCPIVNGTDWQMVLGPIDESKLNRIAAAPFRMTRRKREQSLEIDLKRVCNLTHIGTLGGYPINLKSFPDYHNDIFYRNNHAYKGRGQKNRRYPQITIVEDERELSWVTRYKLEYRDTMTGKWFQYENSFVGNHDVSTEQRHKISLIARYLRITPLEYRGRKSMRILIYGEGARQAISSEEPEVKTICYTITPSSALWMNDNGERGGGGCTCEYCLGLEDRKLKRKMIADEIKYYHNAI